VLIDAGVGTYTRKTFSNERYSIWTMQSGYHNVPQINGAQQVFGDRYRARDLKVDERRKIFSLDISQAYPTGAGVQNWVRSYRLSNDGLVITDSFRIDGATTPNRLNFLTWGEVDASKPGVVNISLNGKTYSLSYDAGEFESELETIPQDDRRLSNVWGDRLIRISLVAKDVVDRNNYTIRIK
jgi:hypothetical protein